jgi:spectinomycin phosphotransferase
VLERPAQVTDADLLAEVRRTWDAAVDAVVHLPVGFGAHHWAAHAAGSPLLFVTYDQGDAEALTDLEASYAGAVALREGGLEFVLGPLRTASGHVTVPFAGGALSCSPWHDGTSGAPLDVGWTTGVLARLHTAAPPPGIPAWRPKVAPDFATTTARLLLETWGPGPYAGRAHDAVSGRLDDIERWTRRYHHLGALAQQRPWVAAHGEPHEDNQLRAADGRFLVDWDTLRLAPAELDLRVLVDAGASPGEVGADTEMLELFDLQWRLDEISQYSAWFAAPHEGTADDEIAFDGLLGELARP